MYLHLLLGTLFWTWGSIFTDFAPTAETYHIVHIQGDIQHVSKNVSLQRGMTIYATDKVLFKSSTAKAVVISSAKGRFVLAPPAQNKAAKFQEVVVVLSEVIFPIKKTNANLSIRAVGGEQVFDLKQYFGEGQYYIIGDMLKVRVSQEKYPLNDNKSIVYRFIYQGKAINRKVIYTEDVIQISAKELFTDKEGKAIDPADVEAVELYQFTATPKSAEKILIFQPIFLPEEELKESLNAFLKVEKNITDKQKALLDFFQDAFGKTDEQVLTNWIAKNIN
jgi:hypothetical protein